VGLGAIPRPTVSDRWHVRGKGYTVWRGPFSLASCCVLMTNDSATTFPEISARLNELAEKLKTSMSLTERREFLKKFQELLDQADRLIVR
jgi:hypothetical protein